MRKDTLAAGARKAQFSVGSAKANEAIELKNVAPEDENVPDAVPEVAKAEAPKKRFIPLFGVLLVRRTEAASQSSIIITEAMEKEQPAEGTVVAAGDNEEGVNVGDYVVFGKYAGAEFRLNGEVLLLMNSDEIKGKLVSVVHDEQSWDVPPCSAIGRA